MKILITGAFGNLGLMCIDQALKFGYEVKCFDLDTPLNQKISQRYGGKILSILGDIRDTACLEALVSDVDAIIHNASLLPPTTENNPELAEEINVNACKRLIESSERAACKPVFIFPSSFTVFGLPTSNRSLKDASDAVDPTDNYTRHKVAIEQFLKQSSVPWVILRVGVSVDARTLATDRTTFSKLLSVKADNPMEYVHPKDVALAMCQAARMPEAIGKVMLIGGGESCQISQRVFLRTAFQALGLNLPLSLHGEELFYTHWLDTVESERILQFQKHTFNDYVEEMNARLKPLKYLMMPFRWLVNPLLSLLLKKLHSTSVQ